MADLTAMFYADEAAIEMLVGKIIIHDSMSASVIASYNGYLNKATQFSTSMATTLFYMDKHASNALDAKFWELGEKIYDCRRKLFFIEHPPQIPTNHVPTERDILDHASITVPETSAVATIGGEKISRVETPMSEGDCDVFCLESGVMPDGQISAAVFDISLIVSGTVKNTPSLSNTQDDTVVSNISADQDRMARPVPMTVQAALDSQADVVSTLPRDTRPVTAHSATISVGVTTTTTTAVEHITAGEDMYCGDAGKEIDIVPTGVNDCRSEVGLSDTDVINISVDRDCLASPVPMSEVYSALSLSVTAHTQFDTISIVSGTGSDMRVPRLVFPELGKDPNILYIPATGSLCSTDSVTSVNELHADKAASFILKLSGYHEERTTESNNLAWYVSLGFNSITQVLGHFTELPCMKFGELSRELPLGFLLLWKPPWSSFIPAKLLITSMFSLPRKEKPPWPPFSTATSKGGRVDMGYLLLTLTDLKSLGSLASCQARYLANTMVDLTCICVDGDKYVVDYRQTVNGSAIFK